MSKALVMPGMDFSANALDTVELSEVIPCRSIVLSQGAANFDEIGDTVTLTATITPADATYPVVWSTSNGNVATVSNGVVTCVGVGTATITATCGEHSASCTITSAITYQETDLTRINGYGLIRHGTSSDDDALKELANATYAAFAFGENGTGGYQCTVDSATPRYAIPLPKNATSVNIKFPDTTLSKFTGVYINFCDSKTAQTKVSGVTAAKYLGAVNVGSSAIGELTSAEITLGANDIPSNADSFVINFRGATGQDPTAWTNPVIIAFS